MSKLTNARKHGEGYLFDFPSEKIDEIFENGHTFLELNGSLVKVTLEDLRIPHEDVEKLKKAMDEEKKTHDK